MVFTLRTPVVPIVVFSDDQVGVCLHPHQDLNLVTAAVRADPVIWFLFLAHGVLGERGGTKKKIEAPPYWECL
jgi:hypothetical protein